MVHRCCYPWRSADGVVDGLAQVALDLIGDRHGDGVGVDRQVSVGKGDLSVRGRRAVANGTVFV